MVRDAVSDNKKLTKKHPHKGTITFRSIIHNIRNIHKLLKRI